MSAATYLVGDVFDVMAAMPDRSVDLVLTSPPFLALRSYLPDDHPDKAKEIGSEPTPAEFIDTLLALTAEWGRLISDTGSIAVELGDTYAGSGGSGGDYADGANRQSQPAWRGSDARASAQGAGAAYSGGEGWPMPKSMCLIPHAYALSLSYGRNILTGEPSPAGCWRVRNVIAWCRPNPAVGALGDKVRPATSFMVIACKARDRWFDLDAVRTPPKSGKPAGSPGGSTTGYRGITEGGERTPLESHPAGAPPLDHVGLREGEADSFDDDAWLVSTESSSAPVEGTSLRVHVPSGAASDGIRRTASSDCPLHGSPDRPGSNDSRGGRGDSQTSRTSRTDGRPDQVQSDGSFPTPASTDQSDSTQMTLAQAGAPAASPRSTGSRRTAPARSTSSPDTPSAQIASSTADTSTSPESTGRRSDTVRSSISEACPPVDEHETASSSSRKSGPSPACSCSYWVEVDRDSIPEQSHYATWPDMFPNDSWLVSTESFRGSHYATWPRKLLDQPILTMCPREVCTKCGEPRRRIVDATRYESERVDTGRPVESIGSGHRADGPSSSPTTLGWTDCGCGAPFRRGHILDPFGGSGTTAVVATAHGRDCTLIDLDERNVDLARDRVGMFLTVPEPDAAA